VPLPRSANGRVHPTDYLKLVKKHVWLITALFLVTVVTVAAWTFTQTPLYEAMATVLIEPEPPKVLNIQDVSSIAPGQDYYQTQYQIMHSRAVATRVIDALKLKQRQASLAQAKDAPGALLGAVMIEPRRNTRLALVKVTHASPEMAAELANAFATQYVKYNLDVKLKGAQDALAWLTEQMGDLKAKVQESSTALQNYRVKSGILGLQEQRQITAQKIIDFNKAYLEAQAQRLTIEAKLKELTHIANSRGGAETIFTVADNPLIGHLKAQTAELEVQKSKLLKTYKVQHPEIQKLDAQIDQTRQRIGEEIQTMIRALQTEAKVARAKEETLLGNVNQLRREGQELNEKEIQYSALQRETDSNQQLFEAVLKRLKETGVTGGVEANNVRVIEEAVVPRVPVRPKRTQNLLMSVVAGLVVGFGVALAVEYFDTTLKTPDQVESLTGHPVIGVIPMFQAKG
jgi:succinoglycan biosynthesis transport protein ExoP